MLQHTLWVHSIVSIVTYWGILIYLCTAALIAFEVSGIQLQGLGAFLLVTSLVGSTIHVLWVIFNNVIESLYNTFK